jgi:hypothetical protein
MRGAIDQRRGQRLAAQSPDVHAFLLEDVHGVHARRLSTRRVHSGGRDLDVLPIAEQSAEKPYRHRAPANISCTNEEDAFHDSKPARCRLRKGKIKPNQVNARDAVERYA